MPGMRWRNNQKMRDSTGTGVPMLFFALLDILQIVFEDFSNDGIIATGCIKFDDTV